MNPIIILKDGRKVAVYPTIKKPGGWEHYNKGYSVNRPVHQACDDYKAHLQSLPIYEIPNFQDREVGTELTGVREQWQYLGGDPMSGNGVWVNCTEDKFYDMVEDYPTRIILY